MEVGVQAIFPAAGALFSFAALAACGLMWIKHREPALRWSALLLAGLFLVCAKEAYILAGSEPIDRAMGVPAVVMGGAFVVCLIIGGGMAFAEFVGLARRGRLLLGLCLYGGVYALFDAVVAILGRTLEASAVLNAAGIWAPTAILLVAGLLRRRVLLSGRLGREARWILLLSGLNLAAYLASFAAPEIMNVAPFVYVAALSAVVLSASARSIASVPAGAGTEAVEAFAARHGLSPREREIVGLILQGKPNKEIAAALDISAKTVEAHLGSVYKKAGVAGRLGLFAAAKGG